MTTALTQTTHQERISFRRILFIAGVCLLLWPGKPAFAQWSTSAGITTTSDTVGIGATSPSALLTVGSSEAHGVVDVVATEFTAPYVRFINNLSGGNTWRVGPGLATAGSFSIYNQTVDSFPFNILNGGNVGLGTTSPTQKLHLVGGSHTAIQIGDASVDTGSRLIFNTSDTQKSFQFGFNYNVNGGLEFTRSTAAGGTTFSTPDMVISSGGRVGIGTNTPSTYSLLHVAGNVVVDGDIGAKYQDIAEWVPVLQPIAAGSVVILDPVQEQFVTESSTPYDTRVAGVVSSRPGIILGEAGPDKVRVATTGRVKVRVDATTSPIRRGDLLVSSDKPGFARRSEPVNIGGIEVHRPGTIIGKAIEALDQGEGEILVLLSLQ